MATIWSALADGTAGFMAQRRQAQELAYRREQERLAQERQDRIDRQQAESLQLQRQQVEQAMRLADQNATRQQQQDARQSNLDVMGATERGYRPVGDTMDDVNAALGLPDMPVVQIGGQAMRKSANSRAWTEKQALERQAQTADAQERTGLLSTLPKRMQAEYQNAPTSVLQSMASEMARLRVAPPKATAPVQWERVETPSGVVQVNPVTGETRRLLVDGQPIPGKASAAKTLPMGVESAIADNATVLSAIDQSLSQLNAGAGKSAFGRGVGTLRMIGADRMVTSGADQELAAVVGNVVSQQIKLRSGAAVTASEWPRLRPFIPVLDGPGADDVDTVRRKLQKMREIIADETNARADYYEGQGYAVPAIPGRSRGRVPPAGQPAGQPDLSDPGFQDYLRSRGVIR